MFSAVVDGSTREVTVPWSEPLTERPQIRLEIERMYHEACAALGVSRGTRRSTERSAAGETHRPPCLSATIVAAMPKITGGSLEEHRQRTQERIFTALERLLGDHGYDSITLADIAAEASIGRTVMYNYYPDKESLLLEFAGRETEEYQSRLEAALLRSENPVEQLQVFIRMQLRQLTTQHIAPGSLRAVLTEAGHRRMIEHVEPLARILRDVLQRAQDERPAPLTTSTSCCRW